MTPARPSHGTTAVDFNGDFDELEAVIRESWADNNEQPLNFTSEFLASALAGSGCAFELAPAIYTGSRLTAFAAAFPRTVRWGERELRAALITFVTVARGSKGQGYGRLIWREMMDRTRRLGYDAAFHYCVEGDAMNRMMPELIQALELPCVRVFRVPFMAHFLRPAGVIAVDVADEDATLIDTFMRAAGCVSRDVPFARTWSRAEAEWQCRGRYRALATAHTAGNRYGAIAGYVLETGGAKPVGCAIIDDLLWDGLEEAERKRLLDAFLNRAAAAGAQMVVSPVLGYADTNPLLSAGFRKSRRVLHAYLTLWNGDPPEYPFESMYLDVF
jgi:hypothetical protein